MVTHEDLVKIYRQMPEDYEPYGDVDRWGHADCSCGCKFFAILEGTAGADWGVCTNPKSHRCGLLTFEHQGCPHADLGDGDVAEGVGEMAAYDELPQDTEKLSRRIAAYSEDRKGPLETPCRIWMRSPTSIYGQISVTINGQRKMRYVHRLAFVLRNGATPDGFELHHKCETTRCVNPDHLELVTHGTNVRKSAEKKTHCVNGHPFSGTSLGIASDGTRRCRTCALKRAADFRARKRRLREKNGACVHGHEMTSENSYVDPAGRMTCRQCRREHQKKFRDGRKIKPT